MRSTSVATAAASSLPSAGCSMRSSMRVMVEAHSWKCVEACSEGLGAGSCWDQTKAACTSSDQL